MTDVQKALLSATPAPKNPHVTKSEYLRLSEKVDFQAELIEELGEKVEALREELLGIGENKKKGSRK